MQKRTLTILPTILLPIGLVVLGLAVLFHQRQAVSRVEATKVDTNQSSQANQSVSVAVQAPDVTVDGKHIDVPANGSVSARLSDGGQVQVTTSHSGGSSNVSTPPDSSVSVSTHMESNNQSSSHTNTQVFSSSSVSNWSHDNVFSTGTSNVTVTH